MKWKSLNNDKIKVGENSKISLKMAIIFSNESAAVPGNVGKKSQELCFIILMRNRTGLLSFIMPNPTLLQWQSLRVTNTVLLKYNYIIIKKNIL